ncbi:o-succinylbenzoate synthase [Celerinatantimonas yamalensis]|uniref:o-succinylbenzoate synthase n=1 Tax=Celerinatantimonas yamalensis TaxID=559956 RepID=A0ABW9G9S7_9GAMM
MHHCRPWQLQVWLYQQRWHCPWATQLTHRRGLYLALQTPFGKQCWGEVAPLPKFSQESLRDCWRALLSHLNQQRVAPPAALAWGALCANRTYPQAIAPLSAPYPLLQGSEETILSHLRLWPQPLTRAKLKVARGATSDELALIKTIHAHYPTLRLRLDANGGWTRRQARTFIAQLPMDAIEYIEQPCQTLADCVYIAQQNRCPIALDESLQREPVTHCDLRHISALVIKPMLLGHNTEHYCQLAQRLGLTVSISSSFESPLGLAHLRELATTYHDTAPGLDTLSYFSGSLQQRLIHQSYWPDNPLLNFEQV